MRTLFTDKQLLMLIGSGALAFLYLKGKIEKTAAQVGNAVNPVNPDNIFYGGVNEIGSSLTGDEHFSLGSWIYEKIHGE